MQLRHPRRWLAVSAVALVLFLVLAFAARNTPYFPFDPPITRALQSWRTPWLDVLMDAAGQPGSPPQTLFLNPLLIVIVFLCGLRREALTLLIFIPLIGSLGILTRGAIDRMRPDPALVYVMHPNNDPHFAFPSGHTVNFVCVLGFLIYVALVKAPPSWHRNLLLGVYALALVLIAVSRIYVADHWFSDVIGGLLLGTVFLGCMIVFYDWLGRRAYLHSQRIEGKTGS
jgi:undecaprenyl-diphosphatase